jgi:hypothetical protein
MLPNSVLLRFAASKINGLVHNTICHRPNIRVRAASLSNRYRTKAAHSSHHRTVMPMLPRLAGKAPFAELRGAEWPSMGSESSPALSDVFALALRCPN